MSSGWERVPFHELTHRYTSRATSKTQAIPKPSRKSTTPPAHTDRQTHTPLHTQTALHISSPASRPSHGKADNPYSKARPTPMPAQNDCLGSPTTAAAKPSVQAGRKHTHWRCGQDSRCVLLLLRADLLEQQRAKSNMSTRTSRRLQPGLPTCRAAAGGCPCSGVCA